MTEEEHALLVKAAKHVSGLWGKSDDWERFMEEAEDYIDFARPEIEAPLRARIAELEAAIDLFIAYDETDDEAMVAMVQCYDAAIEAARKVRGK